MSLITSSSLISTFFLSLHSLSISFSFFLSSSSTRNWWQDCCKILYHELLILSKSRECHVTLTTPLSQIPVNLLRASQILTFESPAGIKGNLIRTFTTVPVTRMCREPHERAGLPVVMVTHYCRRSSDMHLWVGLRSESLSFSLCLCVCVCLFFSLSLSLSFSLFNIITIIIIIIH